MAYMCNLMRSITCVLLWITITVSEIQGNVEYCERDVFEPSCGHDEVILMKSAFYGRMAIGKCIKQNYGHIGCKADVLSVMDGFCSGRQSCAVKPTHDVLIDAKAKVCPSDVAAYLLAEHTCIKVLTGSQRNCQSQGFIPLRKDNGYISISHNGMIANAGCPWRISLSPGRKVNITMMNFPPTPSVQNAIPSSACYEIGSIKENGKTVTMHKCLNDARQKQIYVSSGGVIDIAIPNKETLDTAGHFILHYQAGSGCGDPEIPPNTEVHRNKDTAVIQCKMTSQKWELTCKDGQWAGKTEQCIDESTGWSFLGLFDHEHPYGTAIVVGIGATVGVLVGGILLYIIISIFKRCQKSDYTMTYEYTDPSFAHIPTDYHADKSNLLIQDDKLFEQNSNTWGSQSHGNGNTLSRGGTDHSRVPLPPLPNDNNTLSYEKPLYNRNGNL